MSTNDSDPNTRTPVSRNLSMCELPVVSERPLDAGIDPNRASLIRDVEKKWANGTVLHFHFFDQPSQWGGDDRQKDVVRESLDSWKDLGIGLEFEEVADATDAEIRIGFDHSAGSWSYVGRDAIDLVDDPTKRTMNFGWDLTTPYGRETALHEIGHALGFPHEHQNPNSGIVWDEPAVYKHFAKPPNSWGPRKTHWNVIRKLDPNVVEGSPWDKDSIMHYRFEAGLILQPEQYQSTALIPDAGLSARDVEEVRRFYPAQDRSGRLAELEPYSSRKLEIAAGEQLDFVIKPDRSRRYTIQTFGSLDTVIVLFQDLDGTPAYVAGDDDGGTSRNARLQLRLIRGATYILRLRLYWSSATGESAVMLW